MLKQSKHHKIKTKLKKPSTKVDLIGRVLEMPPGSIGKGAHIELSSNREATVDGCQGVITYDENKIKLNVGSGTVEFVGRGLEITVLAGTQAVIRGFIIRVDFEM